jgi:hypothetical protein
LVILYGIGDNYHPDHSEVPAALIRRFHEARLGSAASVTVWGSAVAYRNFLNGPGFAGEPMSDVSRNEESRHGRRRHIGSHAREAFAAKGAPSRLRQPVAWSWLGGEMEPA